MNKITCICLGVKSMERNGFVIEQLIEETDRDNAIESDSDFGRKALMLPTAFVIKARKSDIKYNDRR